MLKLSQNKGVLFSLLGWLILILYPTSSLACGGVTATIADNPEPRKLQGVHT